MTLIRNGNTIVRCPLCHKEMVQKYHSGPLGEPAQGFFVLTCKTDKIIIRKNDPMVGNWEENSAKEESIVCPNPKCESHGSDKGRSLERGMRIFTTSVGYMKAKCSTCKTTVAGYTQGVTKQIPGTGVKGKRLLH